MGFRDDHEATRARAEALARELEDTKEELAAAQTDAKRARAELREKASRAQEPAQVAAKKSKTAPLTKVGSVFLVGGVLSIALVVSGLGVMAFDATTSTEVPYRVGAVARPQDCSCRLSDGERVALEARVVGVRLRDDMPSRAREWSLAWRLVYAHRSVPLLVNGAPHEGVLSNSGHLYSLAIGCPAQGGVVIGGGGQLSAYAADTGRSRWNTTVMGAFESGGGLGGGLRLHCEELHFDGAQVRVPRDDATSAHVDVDDGQLHY